MKLNFSHSIYSENLIPAVDLSKENLNNFTLLVNNDNKNKLTEKFEEFYSGPKNQTLFCGVSLRKIFIID